MISLKLVRVEGEDQLRETISSFSKKAVKKLPEAARFEIQGNIRRGGQNPEEWPELAWSTEARKTKRFGGLQKVEKMELQGLVLLPSTPLYLTGALYESLGMSTAPGAFTKVSKTKEGTAISIGTTIWYGAIHQTGMTIHFKKRGFSIKIPARPFMGIGTSRIAAFTKFALAWMELEMT